MQHYVIGLYNGGVCCVFVNHRVVKDKVCQKFSTNCPWIVLCSVFQIQRNQRYGWVAAESLAIPQSFVSARYCFLCFCNLLLSLFLQPIAFFVSATYCFLCFCKVLLSLFLQPIAFFVSARYCLSLIHI